MEIIYKKTIVERVDEAIKQAAEDGRMIEKIVLDEEDFREFYKKTCYGGETSFKTGTGLMNYNAVRSLFYNDTNIVKKEIEHIPQPKLLPGRWICGEKKCHFFKEMLGGRPYCNKTDKSLYSSAVCGRELVANCKTGADFAKSPDGIQAALYAMNSAFLNTCKGKKP